MRAILKKCGAKIDVEFASEFEGPILEIFRDFFEIWSEVLKVFKSLVRPGGARASSEGEGEAKA